MPDATADATADVAADLRLLAEAAAVLNGVDAALRRIDAGSYGRCETCATAIADSDLAADPLVVTCCAHRAVQ